jgi:hypothetical protein
MIGPTKKPQGFGFKKGDSHLIANDITETLTAWSFEGTKLWVAPAMCRGIGGYNWRVPSGDTPPGLYKIGEIYNDYAANPNPGYDRTLMAFGWVSFDLVELENQEAGNGRAGIMLHGGGSGNGWPGAWAPEQRILPTFGCIRAHNIVLRDKVLPLTKKGKVFVSVYQ